MPEAANVRECRKLIGRLERRPYFSAALVAYNEALAEIRRELAAEQADAGEAARAAFVRILPRLRDVMRSAQKGVEKLIQSRIASEQIANADQARKAAAGNIFQQLFAYALAQNIVCGNIAAPVVVTTSVRDLIDKYAAIQVGDGIQKPDSDVIVYSLAEPASPILNFSCKTSCRERAGQTYKWKLLCDLAACRCEHMVGNENCPATKYRLRYDPEKPVKMCFVTADFYDELSNPQISGLFHFFDFSYVAKRESPDARIRTLDAAVRDIDEVFAPRA